jgi:hypothetical protein
MELKPQACLLRIMYSNSVVGLRKKFNRRSEEMETEMGDGTWPTH